jgi:RNA polymerase sigma factor (sigma-70 family)
VVDDFDRWYAELRPTMGRALTAWCGDIALASDALDEAFVRAVERWDRVGAMDARAGWVWRTATNVVRRRMRRIGLEQRALRRHRADGSDSSPGPEADDLDLLRALRCLSERQRTAVVLHYVADLSQADVASLMGITTGTVAATLHQARARLAELVGEPDDAAIPAPRIDGGER